MKTKDFLKEHDVCTRGAKWALAIGEDMDAVWNAMVEQGKYDWLLWTATRPGVFPDSALRKLACRFIRETPIADGRKVWDLLTDERSRNAVEVAEAYADGKATKEDMDAAYATAYAAARAACATAYAAARAVRAACAAACAACAAAYAAAYAAADAAAYDAADAAADAAAYAAADAGDAAYAADADAYSAADSDAYAAAKSAQVRMIAELGNPFKEEEGQEDE